MEICAHGQLRGADRIQNDPFLCCSLVPGSWWLCMGNSWAWNLSRIGGLTCACRCNDTPGRSVLFPQNLDMEHCGRGSGCKLRKKASCLRLPLSYFDLSALYGSLWAEVVVLHVLKGLSALLGDPLSHCSIWVWRTEAQVQLSHLVFWLLCDQKMLFFGLNYMGIYRLLVYL